jgi:hypothetical protein
MFAFSRFDALKKLSLFHSQKALIAIGIMGIASGCASRQFNRSQQNSDNSENTNTESLMGQDWRPAAGKNGFQGFVLTVKPMIIWQTFDYATETTEKVISATKLKGIARSKWIVRPFGTNRYDYVVFPEKPMDFKQDIADALANEFREGGEKLVTVDVMWADNRVYGTQNFEGDANPNNIMTKGLDTRDPEWSLKYTNVTDAWKILEKEGKGKGTGIKIGVIDTGLLQHPEVWPQNLAREKAAPPWIDWTAAANFRPEEKDTNLAPGEDPYTFEGRPSNPGHGTAVSGVIVAPPGKKIEGIRGFTRGVAPDATIIPVRVTPSTVMWNEKPMSAGIDYAIAQGAKIISISIGGTPHVKVRQSIRRAVKEGAIVFAAAGNGTPVVVWPGAYPETIAIGAGTIECKPWSKSSPGTKVEVLAPGSEIWYPATFRDRKTQELIWSIRRGQGTSFAAPHAAGIAALWLAKHGWENIVAKYEGNKSYVSYAFRYILNSDLGHRKCIGINPNQHGKGMINAKGILQAPLPSKEGIDLMLADRGPVRLPKLVSLQRFVSGFADAAKAVAEELRGDVDERFPDLFGLTREEKSEIFQDFAKSIQEYIAGDKTPMENEKP